MRMPLTDFCAAVNELDKEDCARLNANPTALFKAEHIALPESMLKFYYMEGYTPAEAYSHICQSLEDEARAEAAAS